uniref:NB-ARC domain-containing protein n=1 Tax=Leersia perrieri TaxID=77586 RepID=A0A0D9WIZ5_9ORYZ
MPHGSKIIVTSRSEKIARFGTTGAVRLKCLPTEAYWYYFKVFVFGSADPEEHPKMTSVATDVAAELRGSLFFSHVVGALLRVHFDDHFWRRVLECTREYMQNNLLLTSEYPHELKTDKNHPRFAWRIREPKPVKRLLIYDSSRKDSEEAEVPNVTLIATSVAVLSNCIFQMLSRCQFTL